MPLRPALTLAGIAIAVLAVLICTSFARRNDDALFLYRIRIILVAIRAIFSSAR